MKIKHAIFLMAMSSFVIAQAQSSRSVDNATPFLATVEVVSIPHVNSETEAEIGQTIISMAKVRSQPIAKVKKDVTISRKAGFFDNNWSFSALIKKQDALVGFLRSPEGSFYIVNPNLKAVGYDGFGVFVPVDASKPKVTWWALKSVFTFGEEPLEVEQSRKEIWEEGSFKRELVYSGISQNTVNLTYREFKDNYARPAFNQDLKYDLSQGDVIGFRGARFQVLKADNISLRYKLLKPFSETVD